MGFKIHSYDGSNRVEGIEYMPASAITPKIGTALKMTDGKLAVASGTSTPTYLSMCERDSACAAGDIIPVIRVHHGVIYETSFSAAASAVKPGDKVTISGDGGQVTATTTGGVAEIVYIGGTAKDDMCRVRFV